MSYLPRALRAYTLIMPMAAALLAQAPASIRGILTDPSGAGIPGATVTVTGPGGAVRVVTSTGNGTYTIIGLPTGLHTIRVAAPGFAVFEKSDLDLSPARAAIVDASLLLAADIQEITVTDEPQMSTDPAGNASATVLSGSDLDILSDDPDNLASDLQALAGPSAGPDGGQLFVDGFSNGQVPPKSSIREIRVNSNPFSAEFDRIGYGRVEILTKPGTDKLHGMVLYQVDTAALDARNPYATSKPSFLSRQFQGNVGGAINKKSSFFLDFNDRYRDDQVLVRANLLGPNFGLTQRIENVSTPTTRRSISPRIDYQLGNAVTLQARYTWTDTRSENTGVGQFSLPTQATNEQNTNQSAQLTGTWVVNATTVNESRFQYTRTGTTTTGHSGSPTISASGAFTGGAATINYGLNRQDSYEYQNYASLTRGTHFIKAGVRIRGALESNRADQNFNGTFSYASIDAYAATVRGLASNFTMPQIIASGGGPFQYALTAGNPFVGVNQVDAAPFIQDDWRLRPNFTLSLGLRYEIQTNISDSANLAPRVGFSWGIGGSGPGKGRSRTPKTVVRGGFGIFYDRLNISQSFTAQQFDGITQQRYVVNNPGFACVRPEDLAASCTGIPSLTQLGGQPSATYRIDPGLMSPRILQTSFGIERQLPKNMTLSLNYSNSRGVHQLRTRNIGFAGPLYQFESGGLFKYSQLFTRVNARFNARHSMFGFYSLGTAHSNTDGVNTFPSSSYDLSTEWGRAQFDIRHSFLIGGNISAPLGIRLSPLIRYASAAPFNIVVGRDLNGDTIGNDRPSFATAASNPLYVVRTRYGDFNTRPAAGETIIPRNYGEAFGNLSINLRIGRTWGFGEVATRGGGGNGPRGGGGPGGFVRNASTNHRYNLTASIDVRNLLNMVNPGAPVGTLSSPQFGQAQGIANGFGRFGNNGFGNGSAQSANRRVELQLRFTF